jgi:transposase
MISKPRRFHLEIQHHRSKPYGVIRSSYREAGKVKHSNHGRLSGLPLEQLKLLQAAFRGEVVPKDSPQALQLVRSKEYGASAALLALAKQLGLDRALYSRTSQPWVADVLAMIVGRVLYAGSKLALSNEYKNTALWQLCGVHGKVDVERHCYQPLDRLLERQQAIQCTLAKNHLQNGHLVLYDITSSYFEGVYEASELICFGYNRDAKRGHQQMVIALLCSEQGCPVGVEVFPGNTQDATTVSDKVAELQQRYGLKELIFVGDRGMITQTNADKLQGVEGLCTISALTHRQIVSLLERKVLQPELFDETQIVEVIDPEAPQRRYCLCRNPHTATREERTRAALLEKTRLALDKIAASKRKASSERLGARVGKVLQHYKVGKLVRWHIEEGHLHWQWEDEKLAAEARFDGCYIVSTDVPAEQMAKAEVVAAYKKLSLVETAFRNLKTVQLEVRPVYHKLDDRIRAHVFLCTLAYYLQWHLTQRLQPLFDSGGRRKKRQWTLKRVLHRLQAIRREKVSLGGVEFEQVTLPEPDQVEILKLLKVRIL